MSQAKNLAKLAQNINTEGLLGSSAIQGGVGGTFPTITSIAYIGNDTATNTAGNGTVTINGTNFNTGVAVLVGNTQVGEVTRVSATQLTFPAPANAAGSYILYVVNTDGGTALAVPGIQYSGVPAWSTAAGSLGSPNQTTSFSTTVAATGDAPVTYSLVGSLPSGINLNTSTGVISGTTPSVSSSTTYNFTIRATDAQNQDTDRAFNLTVLAVTVSAAPTIGTATATSATSATVTFTAPTDNGNSTITSYTATSTPGNLIGTISQAGSGTITVSGLSPETSYTFTVTATNSVGTSAASAASNQTTTSPLAPTINFLVVAGGGSGGMQGNRAGGGGGAGGLKTSYTAGGGPSGVQLSPITAALGTQYTVTIGGGGASTPAGSPQHGFQGTSSVFSTITTTGGGGGGAITDYGVTSPASRKNGGSGGGANGYENTPGTGLSDEGFGGGTGSTQLSGYAQGTGGGGGGATAVGYNGAGANGSHMYGGGGGPGRVSTITGTSVTYAGGGGGAATNFAGPKTAGIGGPGGGGAGGVSDAGTAYYYGSPGSANTGGGGGGASQYPENGSGWPGRSGTGGSGVVILRYPSSFTIGLSGGLTGTTITDGSSKVTTITAGTGTVSWS